MSLNCLFNLQHLINDLKLPYSIYFRGMLILNSAKHAKLTIKKIFCFRGMLILSATKPKAMARAMFPILEV